MRSVPTTGIPSFSERAGRSISVPRCRCDVAHVENENRRQAQIEHLAHQEQIAFDVGRIGDAEDRVNRPHVGLAAQKHVDGDHFVRRARREAVRAGKIDEAGRCLAGAHLSDFFLDRHAGIVADVRCIPASALNNVLLPVFGLPTRATVIQPRIGGVVMREWSSHILSENIAVSVFFKMTSFRGVQQVFGRGGKRRWGRPCSRSFEVALAPRIFKGGSNNPGPLGLVCKRTAEGSKAVERAGGALRWP